MKSQADAFYQQLNEIMNFSLDEGSVQARRDSLIERLESAHQGFYDKLWPHIAYISSRTQDFDALGREARAKIQQIEDATKKQQDELSGILAGANEILEEIRTVAAEQGVSKQAEFFKGLAVRHETQGRLWLVASVSMLSLTVVYSFLGLFVHLVPNLLPPADAGAFVGYQFVASKVLVFAVLAYGTYASIRNYFNHQHNYVINKQKQTALQTYRVLAESASGSENRDIILTHAAACIFGLPDTGFTRGGDSGAPHTSMIEILRNSGPAH